jgi:hypothetical protein
MARLEGQTRIRLPYTGLMASIAERFRATLSTCGLWAAMRSLNADSPYRFTAIFGFDGDLLKNVCLIDKEDLTVKSCADQPITESYCIFIHQTAAPFSVEHALRDTRVNGHPKQRAYQCYYGIPLVARNGKLLGTVCHFLTGGSTTALGQTLPRIRLRVENGWRWAQAGGPSFKTLEGAARGSSVPLWRVTREDEVAISDFLVEGEAVFINDASAGLPSLKCVAGGHRKAARNCGLLTGRLRRLLTCAVFHQCAAGQFSAILVQNRFPRFLGGNFEVSHRHPPHGVVNELKIGPQVCAKGHRARKGPENGGDAARTSLKEWHRCNVGSPYRNPAADPAER